MKLQSRVLISVLSSLVVCFALTQAVQNYRAHELMHHLADESLKAEETAYFEVIENLRKASEASLMGAMTDGEMDKFKALLNGQKEVTSIKELSLANFKGLITHSTVPSRLRQELPADLKDQLLKSDTFVRRRTDGVLEVFHPLKTASCMECHPEFKGRDIGGVFIYRFSTVALDDAGKRWISFVDQLTYSNLWMAVVSGTVTVLLLAAVLLWLIRRQIARPLGRVESLLKEGAEEVGRAAGQIAVSSRTLAEGSSEQAASTEEASASLEEMNAMTKHNAEDAASARELAQAAKVSAEAGVSSVQILATTMREISEASSRMGSTLKVIDEISFQTNILALNAAVEAARAGEAGAGFAVVAEEVRNLALRSAESARSISSMMSDTLAKVGRGEQLGEEVGRQLREIHERTVRQAELIEKIARASQEQMQGTQQITEAVHSIDSVTQKNTATSEESSAMAQQLNANAKALQEDVEMLVKLVEGER